MSYIRLPSSKVKELCNKKIASIWNWRIDEYLRARDTFFYNLYRKIFRIQVPTRKEIGEYLEMIGPWYGPREARIGEQTLGIISALLTACEHVEFINISVSDLEEIS